jgi:hypothetical protein
MAGGSIADTRIHIRLQPLLVAKHCSGVAQLRALRRFFVPANLRTRIGVSWHIGLRARIALGRHLESASSNNSRFVTVQLGSPSITARSRAPAASAFALAFFVGAILVGQTACQRHAIRGRAAMSDPRVARLGYAMGFRATWLP